MKCWSTPMQGKSLGLALLITTGFRVSCGGFSFAECFKGKVLACSQDDDGRFAIIFTRLRISLNRIKMDMWPDRVPGQSEKENTLTPHKSSLKLLGQEFLHGLMSPLLTTPTWSPGRGCWLSGVSCSRCLGPHMAVWEGAGGMVGVTSELPNQRAWSKQPFGWL